MFGLHRLHEGVELRLADNQVILRGARQKDVARLPLLLLQILRSLRDFSLGVVVGHFTRDRLVAWGQFVAPFPPISRSNCVSFNFLRLKHSFAICMCSWSLIKL